MKGKSLALVLCAAWYWFMRYDVIPDGWLGYVGRADDLLLVLFAAMLLVFKD